MYLAAIAYLCLWNFQNLPQVSRTFFGLETDKIVHFLMFLPYPILLYYSIGKRFTKHYRAILFILLIFVSGCAIAAVTEILQGQTEYRCADIKDFRADAISLAVGSLIVFIIDLFRK